MISFVITTLILFGLVLGAVIWLAIKFGSNKQKLLIKKKYDKANNKAKKLRRDIGRLDIDSIRSKLRKKWKK